MVEHGWWNREKRGRKRGSLGQGLVENKKISGSLRAWLGGNNRINGVFGKEEWLALVGGGGGSGSAEERISAAANVAALLRQENNERLPKIPSVAPSRSLPRTHTSSLLWKLLRVASPPAGCWLVGSTLSWQIGPCPQSANRQSEGSPPVGGDRRAAGAGRAGGARGWHRSSGKAAAAVAGSGGSAGAAGRPPARRRGRPRGRRGWWRLRWATTRGWRR